MMPRFARTISFRLTVLYAGLFAASTAIVFGIVYGVATSSLNEQLRLSIEAQMTSLETKASAEPLEELAAEINRLLASPAPRNFFYSLTDKSGRQIAGNFPNVGTFAGWRELPFPEEVENETGASVNEEVDFSFLAYGQTLAGGGHLVVAADTFRLQEARESIVRAFGWAAAVTLLLAVVGGVALSQGFLRRVDEINRTMHAINSGDLSDRIRTRGTGDELDELAAGLNRMLDRLQDLMEGLRQVSNDVAHDLRTPLSRLKQRLESARIGAHTVDDYERAVDQALEDADKALATFGAVLRIAQIESGTRRANFTDLDLSSLIASLTQTYAAVAEDAGKSFVSSVAPNQWVHGDRELLTQMFVNLIENSLRHTPTGSEIRLSVKQGTTGPEVEVCDNGPGIPESERANVFKRFYRLESSRSTPGSGLGLALVGAVADLHRATIDLADNHPGLRAVVQFDSAERT